jgi:hypothetical protein
VGANCRGEPPHRIHGTIAELENAVGIWATLSQHHPRQACEWWRDPVAVHWPAGLKARDICRDAAPQTPQRPRSNLGGCLPNMQQQSSGPKIGDNRRLWFVGPGRTSDRRAPRFVASARRFPCVQESCCCSVTLMLTFLAGWCASHAVFPDPGLDGQRHPFQAWPFPPRACNLGPRVGRRHPASTAMTSIRVE